MNKKRIAELGGATVMECADKQQQTYRPYFVSLFALLRLFRIVYLPRGHFPIIVKKLEIKFLINLKVNGVAYQFFTENAFK